MLGDHGEKYYSAWKVAGYESGIAAIPLRHIHSAASVVPDTLKAKGVESAACIMSHFNHCPVFITLQTCTSPPARTVMMYTNSMRQKVGSLE